MGGIKLPRHMFLWSMSVIYMFAFASLYVQIPGLYGNEGILPARWQMRYLGKSLLEQLKDSPTLLWLGPQLALDTQQGMELICLLGATLAFGAMVLEPLRGSLVFFSLWVLYRSVYQVGQVFLYFQWDSLLLEAGFLAVLVAPLNLPWQSPAKHHDATTFWLVRWLLFRLMFASGVVKLTSRCPTWWGLTALTYHYETQCIPSPLAWYAHQLPVWFQKLSIVGTFIIEIPIPFLFFAPIRRLRIFAFYMQVLLQVLIILTGNYNFFNLLTIVLCFSLLDDDHVNFWLRRGKKTKEKSGYQAAISWTAFVIELGVYGLFFYWTALYFGLEINWEKKSVFSKTEFTYHQFNSFLKMVTFPSVWLGMLSLAWEVVTAMYKCACIQGFFWKLWATVQWAVFATAAAGLFAISLVPYTYIEYDSHGNLWPELHKAYSAVDRYHLVGSYGLFRRMTGVGGRPEVVIEGSMDKNTWTEIEFMYKPGNVSGPQPIVAPHQPRLDWQMWFAALGPHTQSPWFPSLVYRLLQGKKDVINLIQVDESQYPFRQQPPTFIRALLYKYWFTDAQENGWFSQQWWRRRYVEEFFPTVHLGDPFLDGLLTQYGLKALSADPVTLSLVFRTVFSNLVLRDSQTVYVFAPGQTVHIFAPSQLLDKGLTRRNSDATVPWLLRLVREHIYTMSGPLVLWSLFSAGATICLLKTLFSLTPKESKSVPSKPNSGKPKETAPPSSKKDHVQKKEEDLSPGHKEEEEEKVQDFDNNPK